MLPDVLNPTPLMAEVLPLLPPRRDKLTLIVKGTFDVLADGRTRLAKAQMPLCGDEHEGPDGDPALVRYESDLVPFKPRADLLCVGHAHAPGGQPVTALAVRFGLVDQPKEIRVVGERRLRMLGPTPEIGPPEPFTAMALSYSRAFGGSDPADGMSLCPTNPHGRGFARKAGAQQGRPMPNLEDPRRPLANLAEPALPAGFGPLGRTWQPRLAHAGTYDERWQTERAPEPPLDFDYGYFNGAPPDQQIAGYLRGDETLWAENLHPELPRLSVRLPGVRIRGFFEASSDLADDKVVEGLRELRLRLDTAWLDMAALRLVLVWRVGLYATHIAEDGVLLIGAERITDEKKPVAAYAAQLKTLRAEVASIDAEADEAQRLLAD